MVLPGEQTFQKLSRLLVAPTLEPSQRAARIQAMEKDVILPLRLFLVAILGYFFFLSDWFDLPHQPRGLGLALLRDYFWFYLLANMAAGAAFIWVRQMSLKTTQWINVTIGLLDVLLMTGLTFIVDGFDSPLYWVFPVLILHNALAIPLALPQILLNLVVTLGYIAGGVLDRSLIFEPDDKVVALLGKLLRQELLVGDPNSESRTENPVPRVIVLVIWAACCYSIQVLLEKQRRAGAEATEPQSGGSDQRGRLSKSGARG